MQACKNLYIISPSENCASLISLELDRVVDHQLQLLPFRKNLLEAKFISLTIGQNLKNLVWKFHSKLFGEKYTKILNAVRLLSSFQFYDRKLYRLNLFKQSKKLLPAGLMFSTFYGRHMRKLLYCKLMFNFSGTKILFYNKKIE